LLGVASRRDQHAEGTRAGVGREGGGGNEAVIDAPSVRISNISPATSAPHRPEKPESVADAVQMRAAMQSRMIWCDIRQSDIQNSTMQLTNTARFYFLPTHSLAGPLTVMIESDGRTRGRHPHPNPSASHQCKDAWFAADRLFI